MPANPRRRLGKIGVFGALAILSAGAASADQTMTRGRYRFDAVQGLPDLPIRRDVRAVQFPYASRAMIETAVGKDNGYGVVDADGHAFGKPLDFSTLPYWIYADYRDRAPPGGCRYVLVDGLLPDADKRLPAAGDVEVSDAEQATAVLRDCGRGFEVVSREVYDSFFGEPFKSAYLKGAGEPPIEGGAVRGLARDYVDRLIRAFGGKDALRRTLQEAQSRQAGHPFLVGMPVLKAAFEDRGVIAP